MKLGIRKHRNYYRLHEISSNSLGPPENKNTKYKLENESVSQNEHFNSVTDQNTIKKVKWSPQLSNMKSNRLSYLNKIKTQRRSNTES